MPLSLDFLMVDDLFKESKQPVQKAVTRSIEARLAERDIRCRGFTASLALVSRLDQTNPNEFARLFQSKDWNHYAFLASNDLDAEQVSALESALNFPVISRALLSVIRHELQDTTIIRSSAQEYPEELLQMLSPDWEASD